MDTLKAKFPQLPERISGLGDLACNLWWSWHSQARMLFEMLDPVIWKLSLQNPVKMLKCIDPELLKAASTAPRFLRYYDSVMAKYRAEMQRKEGWFCANVNPQRGPIAYFSAEYGLHHSLPFYAGGLGFLAGDFLKECSDLDIPLVGLGFMYPGGYLRQRLTPEGMQMSESQTLERDHAPINKVLDEQGLPLVVRVPIIDPPIYVEVWRLRIGRISLYLMDTDIPENEPWNRSITDRLYVGDAELRLRQEIVLGIGGVKVLSTIGIKNPVLHLNEGHPAFAILECIREKIEDGKDVQTAIEEAKANTIFTTHTPVPAGHDVFPFYLMEKYFNTYIPELGLDREAFFQMGLNPADPTGFNMTAFALKMSDYHNCVSRKHLDVTREMWHPLWPNLSMEKIPIDYITNGVHLPSWIDRSIEALFNRYLGPNWVYDHDNPAIWELVDEIPDKELWTAHQALKIEMMSFIRERVRRRWLHDQVDPSIIAAIIAASGVTLDPNVLTLGFARRFATYKRATLILQDRERLKKMLTDEKRPIQIIFAGKAHPADDSAKLIIKDVYDAAKDPSLGGRIAFVEDYDEQLAQYLVHGVDLWLNNPLPPLEGSGTSGMKAAMNGIPQLSILDGWWIEGQKANNGWSFSGANGPDRDKVDSDQIYNILEEKVIPLYYRLESVNGDTLPRGWVKVMKEAIKIACPHFCTRRMSKEYAFKFYQPALNRRD